MISTGVVTTYNHGFFLVSCLMSCTSFCSAADVAFLSESHDLCINGDCFEMLQSTEAVLQVIPYVKVCVHPLYRIWRLSFACSAVLIIVVLLGFFTCRPRTERTCTDYIQKCWEDDTDVWRWNQWCWCTEAGDYLSSITLSFVQFIRTKIYFQFLWLDLSQEHILVVTHASYLLCRLFQG
jgi:hypothetical protein